MINKAHIILFYKDFSLKFNLYLQIFRMLREYNLGI